MLVESTPDSPSENGDQPGPQSLLALCKASADLLRLDVLRVLSRDSFGVLELCTIFGCKQSGMSHHLKILASAGLVTTRREGNSIFYRRNPQANDSALQTLQQALLNTVDQLPLSAEVAQRVENVQQERAVRSRSFFSDNADKFQQQQEQIAAYELYGVNAAELLCAGFSGKATTALELGPGDGAFLSELSPRFKQVIALDNSRQMLSKAEEFSRLQRLDNIQFLHGDSKHPSLQGLDADCVVVNMVLHHIPSPAEIFIDLNRVLRHDGQLFVTDLCSHDQNWVRDACGDLWLGFEPDDLTHWASNAGFSEGQSVYLAQRNGFQVQIRQFIKREALGE